jgi:anti-sigma regulatory factor (Ser/Thr protein kinase)
MNRDWLLKLELRSDPSMLCVVRAVMEQLTEAFGFSAAECRSVTRAVDEALTNIMRHAYRGQLDQPIEVFCGRVPHRGERAEGFEVLLSDEGPAVDPTKLRGRRLDEIKPGGLGLHFIRQSMDVVEFKRVKGKNQLRLMKYLQPAAQVGTGKRREDLADLGPANR